MKKTIAFTVFDDKNAAYAEKLEKSFHYFHPDIPLRMFNDSEVRKTQDPDIFYKQKPYFANKLFAEGYEAVLGLDADMIILGNLDVILKDEAYDVGTVQNFNPLHVRQYGAITVAGIHYATEYFNAGLVMMRSEKFVKQWLKLCNGAHFKRYPYREQDLLNLMLYYGDWNYKCFDFYDETTGYASWHGLLATSETSKTILRDGNIVIPKSEDGYPSQDVLFKVWHPAGGQTPHDKLNYKTAFPDEVSVRITEILAGKK